MKYIILDATESDNQVSKVIQDTVLNSENHIWLKLLDFEVEPCRSCGSCGFKTCGKCVIKDDFEEIIKKIVQSQVMVFLTPIHFGGYSSQLKKVIDRLLVLGVPLYVVKKGHLLHPMRYDMEWIYGIGISDKHSELQEVSFKKLVEHNALNMNMKYKALALNAFDNELNIINQVEDMLQEVEE